MVCDKMKVSRVEVKKNRLNPYSIGIWSATELYQVVEPSYFQVLILILLEYGLRRSQRHSITPHVKQS